MTTVVITLAVAVYLIKEINNTMTDILLSHLASIGLFLDIVGVSITFFVVVQIGEQVIRADKAEEETRKKKKRRKKNILLVGFILIFLGFLLQVISNEMTNNSIKEMKRKIELNNEKSCDRT